MNALFEKGREGFLGNFDWSANKYKAILVDMNDAGPAAGAWVITGVTNTVNPTITTSVAHGLNVGQKVAIFGVGGAVGVNGIFDVATVPTTTTFTVTLASAPGVYTSGGFIANLSLTFLSEFVPLAGRVATSAALNGKTITSGVADANDVSWSSVAGDPTEAVIIVRTAALDADPDLTDTAQSLVAFYGSLSGLPLPANPGTVNWTIDNGVNKLFKL